MKKLKLEIEITVNDVMYSDQEEYEWFVENVLKNDSPGEGLILLSGCIGDKVGEVKVLSIDGNP